MMALVMADLQDRLLEQPSTLGVQFGPGEEQQQTIPGSPGKPFRGLSVLNPSSKTIHIGFEGGSTTGGGLQCPPWSALVWPVRFIQLSLAVSHEDAETGTAEVHVARLPAPPQQPFLGSYGLPSVYAPTLASPREVAVGTVSGVVLAKNGSRKGLSIQNTGSVNVSLGLGLVAIAGHDVVLEPGGSWDGTIGTVLWRGQVNAIAGAASTLAVVEV
jgi:hypothetical protein